MSQRLPESQTTQIGPHDCPINVPKAPDLTFHEDFEVLNRESMDIQSNDFSTKSFDVNPCKDVQNHKPKVETMEEQFPGLDIPYIGVEKADDMNLHKDLRRQQINEISIEQVSSLLQEAIRDIRFLKFEMNVLKVEVIDLRCDLDKARSQILGHQRVFRKLIGSKSDSLDVEYDYESTDENSNAQKVPPQTDQVSD